MQHILLDVLLQLIQLPLVSDVSLIHLVETDLLIVREELLKGFELEQLGLTLHTKYLGLDCIEIENNGLEVYDLPQKSAAVMNGGAHNAGSRDTIADQSRVAAVFEHLFLNEGLQVFVAVVIVLKLI